MELGLTPALFWVQGNSPGTYSKGCYVKYRKYRFKRKWGFKSRPQYKTQSTPTLETWKNSVVRLYESDRT